MWRPILILLAWTLVGPVVPATEAPVEVDGPTTPAPGESPPADTTGIGLKLYAEEFGIKPFGRITYGYDRDAVCTVGTCDDGSPCLRHATCAGIGSGSCNFTPCTNDFTGLCQDGTTVCQTNSDCSGIGDGTCITCAPPNQVCGVKVESLTPGAPPDQTAWELVCDPLTPGGTDCQVGFSLPPDTVSWDFSGFNPTTFPDLKRRSSTTVPIVPAETPNHDKCGFNPSPGYPARQLQREDKYYEDPPNKVSTLNSVEFENDVGVCDSGQPCEIDTDCDGYPNETCTSTATMWLRGVVRFEGIDTAILGLGESRLCHTDDDGKDRTGVALFRFPNQDSGGYYMQLGDPRWQHTPYDCEQVILYPAAVSADDAAGFEARQTGEVVNEGVIRLPSGHRFKSLVVRSVNEYSVEILACLIPTDQVRTVLYLWQVPHLGTVVRIQSDKVAADKLSFTHLAELDVKYGLFPPLSLEVDAVSDTSVDLSWDPGLITEHIDSYRIYWDTESGGQCSTGLEDCTADYPGAGVNCPAGETCCSTPGDVCDSYDFDSVSDAAQVVFHTATSATVGGLDPATTYYFTVRSVSNYTDPASLVTTSYESAQYPTRIPAVPYDLPVEVAAVTTGGISTAGAVPDGHVRPGTPLTLSRGAGESIDLAWGVSCLPGDGNYGVYEGTLGNFSSHTPVTCDTAGATSFSFSPGDGNRYYLIVPTNSSFEGSYGLDGSGAERPVSAAPCLPQNLGDPVCP